MKRKAASTQAVFDLNSPDGVKRFRKAAKAFTAKATVSKAKAREVLVKEGFLTESGKLSKNYR